MTFISIDVNQSVNLKIRNFYICIAYREYFNLFIKVEQIVYVQGHTKYSNALQTMSGISPWCVLISFDLTNIIETKLHFCHMHKHITNGIWFK